VRPAATADTNKRRHPPIRRRRRGDVRPAIHGSTSTARRSRPAGFGNPASCMRLRFAEVPAGPSCWPRSVRQGDARASPGPTRKQAGRGAAPILRAADPGRRRCHAGPSPGQCGSGGQPAERSRSARANRRWLSRLASLSDHPGRRARRRKTGNSARWNWNLPGRTGDGGRRPHQRDGGWCHHPRRPRSAAPPRRPFAIDARPPARGLTKGPDSGNQGPRPSRTSETTRDGGWCHRPTVSASAAGGCLVAQRTTRRWRFPFAAMGDRRAGAARKDHLVPRNRRRRIAPEIGGRG